MIRWTEAGIGTYSSCSALYPHAGTLHRVTNPLKLFIAAQRTRWLEQLGKLGARLDPHLPGPQKYRVKFGGPLD